MRVFYENAGGWKAASEYSENFEGLPASAGPLETCVEGRQLEANLICPEGGGGGRPRKSGHSQIHIWDPGRGPEFENLGA